MKKLSIYLALFFISCIVTTAGNGQTTNVWGKVVDKETLKPLAGVNVSLENNQLGIGTITNQKGEFRLWNLPNDTSNILVSIDGYQNSVVDINTLKGNLSEITVIKLHSKESQEKEEPGSNKLLSFLKKKSK